MVIHLVLAAFNTSRELFPLMVYFQLTKFLYMKYDYEIIEKTIKIIETNIDVLNFTE